MGHHWPRIGTAAERKSTPGRYSTGRDSRQASARPPGLVPPVSGRRLRSAPHAGRVRGLSGACSRRHSQVMAAHAARKLSELADSVPRFNPLQGFKVYDGPFNLLGAGFANYYASVGAHATRTPAPVSRCQLRRRSRVHARGPAAALHGCSERAARGATSAIPAPHWPSARMPTCPRANMLPTPLAQASRACLAW